MDSEPDSVGFDEIDVLTVLVEHYESKFESIGYPSPAAATEFRMEQKKLIPRDLAPFIGIRPRVAEVFPASAISMPMARALHAHLGLPEGDLLREPGVGCDSPLTDMEWG